MLSSTDAEEQFAREQVTMLIKLLSVQQASWSHWCKYFRGQLEGGVGLCSPLVDRPRPEPKGCCGAEDGGELGGFPSGSAGAAGSSAQGAQGSALCTWVEVNQCLGSR